MTKIAIFASGSGSNAQNIIEYFKASKNISISLIVTNNKNAFVIERAKKFGIPYIVLSNKDFKNSNYIESVLKEYDVNFIVLAGFLLKIPEAIVKMFTDKIINIHPALLPKYGGKGMYGMNVHEAVVNNKENESGITIHFVNEYYDEGQIIFQAKTQVLESDFPTDVASKIHELEHKHFPGQIEKIINSIKK